MRKILIGTTNPSKVQRFQEMLSDYEVEFYTLKDLNVTSEPDENGKSPKENALIKAQFYSQYYDVVICADSGLYFDELSLDDERQPGLSIRTPRDKRLDDEEMIQYYAQLISTLGGKVLAYYLDGIAVSHEGKLFSFMEYDVATKTSAFYMIDKPSSKRNVGWPLDSLSINKDTLTYFVDALNSKYNTRKENIILGEYRKRLVAFLVDSLNLKKVNSDL